MGDLKSYSQLKTFLMESNYKIILLIISQINSRESDNINIFLNYFMPRPILYSHNVVVHNVGTSSYERLNDGNCVHTG